MTDDAHETLVDVLTRRSEEVLDAWVDSVSASLRQRTVAAELRTELSALLEAFLQGLRSGDGTRGEAFDEMRALSPICRSAVHAVGSPRPKLRARCSR